MVGVVEKVVKALIDSGSFSEIEVNNVVGIGQPDTVYAFDDDYGVALTIKVKSA